jgi:hypothetical protein
VVDSIGYNDFVSRAFNCIGKMSIS